MNCEREAQVLEKYIRPDSFPLGIRVLRPGEERPAKARSPLRDLGTRLSNCQAIGMARRYGWTLVLGPEDQSCPVAQTVFGFAPSLPFYEEGNLACGMYSATMEAGARAEAVIPKLAPGEAAALAIGPLPKIDFTPEVIAVYANSAQVMRLVAAALYNTGGCLPANLSPRADCAEIITGTRRAGRAQVILPCYGDRVFSMTQDHELCFALPFDRFEDLRLGLEATERAGIRYPIPVNLRFEPDYPPKYKQLAAMWPGAGK